MQLDAQFWTALLQIIGINIVLSGDNAVVIAMACRSLPPQRQKWGIFFGAGAAIVLRIVFTVFIVYLLSVPYLKIVGGLLLFWIGYQLLVSDDDEGEIKAAQSLWHAVRIILVADAVMSLDNVIAVAAAANGNFTLLILGLLISVPLVIYGATVLIKLINRYPAIIPAGAALIGYVAGEVIVTDPVVRHWIEQHAHWLHSTAPLIGAVLIVLVGRCIAPASPKSKVSIAGELAGSAVVFGLRTSLQLAGRALVAAAPLVIGFIASLLGYAAGDELQASDSATETALEILLAVRPVFAAVLAVAIGEAAAWTIRQLRHKSPGATLH